MAELGTYERGEELGCPDCHTGIEHCCPYLYADQLLEPQRLQALRHMRGYFRSVGGHVIAQGGGQGDA